MRGLRKNGFANTLTKRRSVAGPLGVSRKSAMNECYYVVRLSGQPSEYTAIGDWLLSVGEVSQLSSEVDGQGEGGRRLHSSGDSAARQIVCLILMADGCFNVDISNLK